MSSSVKDLLSADEEEEDELEKDRSFGDLFAVDLALLCALSMPNHFAPEVAQLSACSSSAGLKLSMLAMSLNAWERSLCCDSLM